MLIISVFVSILNISIATVNTVFFKYKYTVYIYQDILPVYSTTLTN